MCCVCRGWVCTPMLLQAPDGDHPVVREVTLTANRIVRDLSTSPPDTTTQTTQADTSTSLSASASRSHSPTTAKVRVGYVSVRVSGVRGGLGLVVTGVVTGVLEFLGRPPNVKHCTRYVDITVGVSESEPESNHGEGV